MKSQCLSKMFHCGRSAFTFNQDLFNKTNFYLLLFVKVVDSLHLSSEGPKIKVEIQVGKLQKVTHDRNIL